MFNIVSSRIYLWATGANLLATFMRCLYGCASFYLEYGCASVPPPALLAPPLARQSGGHAVANLAHELLLLQQMRSVGALSDAEFTAAKAKLLC
jgi:hypothetical protein